MEALALKTTLVQLTGSMPAMSGQVGEAIDTAHASFAAGVELGQRTADLAQHADDEVALTQQGVEELGSFADDAKGQLGQVRDQLEAHAQELGELDAPLAAVDDAVGHVEDSFERAQGTLVAGSAALDQASAAAHEHVEALFGTIADGQQKIATGAEEANASFKAVQQSVEDGHQGLVDDTDGLVHQVTEHQETLATKVGGFLDASNQAMGDLSTDLTQTLPQMMQDPVGQALDQVQSKVQEQIQELVKSAMDKVLASLDDFEAKVNDAQKGSELSREILKPLFEEVEELIKPLIGSLDSIRTAANMVGLDF